MDKKLNEDILIMFFKIIFRFHLIFYLWFIYHYHHYQYFIYCLLLFKTNHDLNELSFLIYPYLKEVIFNNQKLRMDHFTKPLLIYNNIYKKLIIKTSHFNFIIYNNYFFFSSFQNTFLFFLIGLFIYSFFIYSFWHTGGPIIEVC